MNPTLNDRWWTRPWLAGLVLVAATVLAYQPAWNAGFIWDDDAYVTQNRLLTAPDGLKRIWFSLDSPSQYFPLTYTTFRAQRSLWGLNASGYHWVNILLHAINALLVWRLLMRLKIPGAWLAAAIFALHPVNVESVAWITELKNVQSLFFCLLALLAWIEFVDRNRWQWYGWTLLFYLLALFSKTTACTLPAALLLVLWLKHKSIGWPRLAQMIPLVVCGVAMGLVCMWWERHHQGTEGKLFALGPLERVLIASRAAWFYLGKLLWPANLSFNYPLWKIHVTDVLAYVWLIAGIALCAAIFYARRFAGRSVETATVFFIATLSPLLGFIMLYTFHYSFVADHYQYMAALGPIALVSAGLTAILWKGANSSAPASWSAPALRRFEEPESASSLAQPKPWRLLRSNFFQFAFCGALLITLGVLTWRQCRMYDNLETLWRVTLARNPNSFMAYNNLGDVLLRKDQFADAMTCFQKTLSIKPDSVHAHCNLGVALFQSGRPDDAVRQYQKALELQPDLAVAHKNLSDVYLQQGRLSDALVHALKAVEIRPNFAEAQNNVGSVLINVGRLDDAILHLQKAVECEPQYPNALNNLGVALIQKGRADDALKCFQSAVDCQPDFVEGHNNLGRLQLQKGMVHEALAHYDAALKLQPNDPDTLLNFAWVLATWQDAPVRNGTRAVELAQRANELTGGQSPAALGTLAAAYAEAGRFTDAVATAERGARLAEAQSNGALTEMLRSQLQLHRAGSPVRDGGKTDSAQSPKQ